MPTNSLTQPQIAQLVQAATAVRNHAHAPYSDFLVGAAVLSEAGEMFIGCNVENASYGLSICAERSALTAMVSAGERKLRGVAVVSAGGVTPCGACRQFLREFAEDCDVIMVNSKDDSQTQWRLAELLPGAFDSSALK